MPDVDPPGNWDESTAVAGYDDVTQQVGVAELAQLVAQAQPTRMVPVLERPARVAAGTATRKSPQQKRPRRFALGLLAFTALLVAWGAAAYEAWYFFLR